MKGRKLHRTALAALGVVAMATALGATSLGWGVAGSADELSSSPVALANDAAVVDEALLAALRAEGEGLYLKNCRQCHGSRGTSGVPLAGNHRIQDIGHVVRTIITGPRYMPAFDKFLSDDEIAAVATFVSTSWGNSSGGVSADAVASLR